MLSKKVAAIFHRARTNIASKIAKPWPRTSLQRTLVAHGCNGLRDAGIELRTLQRWKAQQGLQRAMEAAAVHHARLPELAEARRAGVANEPRFASVPPRASCPAGR